MSFGRVPKDCSFSSSSVGHSVADLSTIDPLGVNAPPPGLESAPLMFQIITTSMATPFIFKMLLLLLICRPRPQAWVASIL